MTLTFSDMARVTGCVWVVDTSECHRAEAQTKKQAGARVTTLRHSRKARSSLNEAGERMISHALGKKQTFHINRP